MPSLKLNVTIICIILCLFSILSSFVYAVSKNDISNMFFSANKLYEQGKYEEAINEYNKIVGSGFQSGPLYYNMGNCYFKLGAIGKTILYYERARRLIPHNPELIFNLGYVQSMLEDKIALPKKNWFVKNILNISSYLLLGKWLAIIVILWLISIISVIIGLFMQRFGKILKYIALTSFILLLICTVFAIIQYNRLSTPSAIVLAKEVTAQYAPGEGEVSAFLLHEGTKVAIKKEEGSWYLIQLPDGKSGWLPKNSIEKI